MPSHNIQKLHVPVVGNEYNIIIGSGLIDRSAEWVKPVLLSNRVIIITDNNVAKHHLASVEESLKNDGIRVDSIIIEPGEGSKSFNSLIDVTNRIFELTPDRKTTLIALGGGIVGDLTGFTASIILRGIPFIQIPTTVLSQVDSSVGGKTGINNSFGKNLVGSFYQPKLVLADTDVLKTLSKREFLAGYAEIVKYSFIGDKEFFHWLNDHKTELLNYSQEHIQYAVRKSCEMKAHIVAQDEKEKGCRALLNLGHTFGHALENITGYSQELLHGEAVAIGMVMAARFSVELGLMDASDAQLVVAHIKDIGLPAEIEDLDSEVSAQKMISLMGQDKKVDDGKMVFILMRAIGDSFVAKDVTLPSLETFLKQYCQS